MRGRRRPGAELVNRAKERAALRLQKCFDLPMNEHRNVGFDSGNLIEFRAFNSVDFMNDIDWRIGLTRQKFNFRFPAVEVARAYCLIVHFIQDSAGLKILML
jgi:hypothetical protein